MAKTDDYVPILDRVRVIELDERFSQIFLSTGDSTESRLFPARSAACILESDADTIRSAIRRACEDVRKRCLGELDLRLGRCHDHTCRDDNTCQRCQALQDAADAIRELKL